MRTRAPILLAVATLLIVGSAAASSADIQADDIETTTPTIVPADLYFSALDCTDRGRLAALDLVAEPARYRAAGVEYLAVTDETGIGTVRSVFRNDACETLETPTELETVTALEYQQASDESTEG